MLNVNNDECEWTRRREYRSWRKIFSWSFLHSLPALLQHRDRPLRATTKVDTDGNFPPPTLFVSGEEMSFWFSVKGIARHFTILYQRRNIPRCPG